MPRSTRRGGALETLRAICGLSSSSETGSVAGQKLFGFVGSHRPDPDDHVVRRLMTPCAGHDYRAPGTALGAECDGGVDREIAGFATMKPDVTVALAKVPPRLTVSGSNHAGRHEHQVDLLDAVRIARNTACNSIVFGTLISAIFEPAGEYDERAEATLPFFRDHDPDKQSSTCTGGRRSASLPFPSNSRNLGAGLLATDGGSSGGRDKAANDTNPGLAPGPAARTAPRLARQTMRMEAAGGRASRHQTAGLTGTCERRRTDQPAYRSPGLPQIHASAYLTPHRCPQRCGIHRRRRAVRVDRNAGTGRYCCCTAGTSTTQPDATLEIGLDLASIGGMGQLQSGILHGQLLVFNFSPRQPERARRAVAPLLACSVRAHRPRPGCGSNASRPRGRRPHRQRLAGGEPTTISGNAVRSAFSSARRHRRQHDNRRRKKWLLSSGNSSRADTSGSMKHRSPAAARSTRPGVLNVIRHVLRCAATGYAGCVLSIGHLRMTELIQRKLIVLPEPGSRWR